MSRMFRVHMHTVASAAVTVELPDEILAEEAAALGKSVQDLTADDLRDRAADLAFENPGAPDICAQCAGWGNPNQSLELGEFELDEDDRVGDVTYPAVVEFED